MEVDGSPYVRTLEDVNTIVHHAKLSRSELQPVSQVFYFADEFPEYKLLECDPSILNYLEKGGELFVRGRPEDKVVVCTRDQTYDLKDAETSNSLLLVPGLKWVEEATGDGLPSEEGVLEERRIQGVHGEYWELKKIKPRLQRLRSLLMRQPYNGPENDGDAPQTSERTLYTLEDILEEVQGSEEEIVRHLSDLEAIEICGYWRLLHHEYQFRALSFLLNLVEERSWPPDAIPIVETTNALKGLVPNVILDHIYKVYLEDMDETTDDDDQLYKLKEDRVCRFLGESLLRPVKKFNLQDFLDAWQCSVPVGLKTELSQLDGLALHDKTANPPVIRYFPEHALPEEPSERFAALFAERRHWDAEQISPFIAPLTTEKQSVNAFLTKFTRSSNVNGRKLYTARYAK